MLALCAAVIRLPWAALALVISSVLCDGLDGAVAVLSHTASRAGAVADKIADRVADIAFVVIIWWCGAAVWMSVAAGVAVLAVEAVRELRGGSLRGTLTVGERPSRAICAGLACISAGLSQATWPASVCAVVLLVLSVIAMGQLAVAARAS